MPTVVAKFLAVTAVAALQLIPSNAWAEEADTTISTGREDGSYFYIGRRLQTTMLLEHDYRIGVETSSGSVQNLARLADPSGNIGLALTQSDALHRFLGANSEFAKEFIVLGDAGKECVVLISAKKDGISNFSQLKSLTDGEISVDDPGSGASATFNYMVEMNPELASVRPVFVDTMEALLQIKVAGAHTDLKAAMLVQRPSVRSSAVKILLENPNDYQLVPILESDVQNSKLPDDSIVYTFEKVKVGGTSGQRGLEVNTICIRGLLLASKAKLSRDIRSKLSLVMLNSAASVIGKDE
jgi:TRAP-type uncharacterized transport system substrate-binding protein